MSDLLRVPAATLEAYPVRGRTDLLNEVQRLWGFAHAERDHELARLQTWLGTYGPDVAGARRSYDVLPLGSVGAVEKWLLTAPARLEPFGYAVSFDPTTGGRWVGAQVPLDDRSTVDLVGRVTRPQGVGRPGDLVVVDLAATCVDLAALDRLMRHVYTLRRRFTSACVHGVLVADGVTVAPAPGPVGAGLRPRLPQRARVPRLPGHAPRRLPHPRGCLQVPSRTPRPWPSTWRCEGGG